MEGIVCASTEDGFIKIFHIDKKTLNVKNILTKKGHEKKITSLENIRNTKNKFVTSDNKNIKIWILNKEDNNYILDCQTVLKDLSEFEIINLYSLNNSNIIFTDGDNELFILNSIYKAIAIFDIPGDRIRGLYQIESNDDNNNKFFVGKSKYLFF